MATQQSMTKRTVEAQGVVLDALARTFGHPAPRFPSASRHGRDHLNMVQWEALAEWVKIVTEVIWSTVEQGGEVNINYSVEVEENIDPDDVTASDGLDIEPAAPTDYDAMTRAELLALADERGVTVAGSRPTKADVIEVLQHADAHN